MLFVAEKETRKILFRIDAWNEDCIEEALTYIKANRRRVLSDGTTSMGDMIIWVE